MIRRFTFDLQILLVICISILLQAPTVSSFRVPLLSEELGCSPTLSMLLLRSERQSTVNNNNKQKSPLRLYYFDPIHLATDSNFARYREAEYKHGRVAMLAMSEIILIPIIKRLLPNDGGTTTTAPSFPPSDHAIVRNCLHLRFNDIFTVLITCGVLEIFILVQQDVTDMPGDYGVGYFGNRNKGLHETQLQMELEHGRLAMISFAIYIILDTTVYQEMSWLDQWLYSFDRWMFPQVLT